MRRKRLEKRCYVFFFSSPNGVKRTAFTFFLFGGSFDIHCFVLSVLITTRVLSLMTESLTIFSCKLNIRISLTFKVYIMRKYMKVYDSWGTLKRSKYL